MKESRETQSGVIGLKLLIVAWKNFLLLKEVFFTSQRT